MKTIEYVVDVAAMKERQQKILEFAVNLGKCELTIDCKNSDVVPCENPKMILATNEYLQNFERGNQ